MPAPSPADLRPAVFFDRDGTLMEEANFCRDPASVRVFPGTAAALRELRAAGFLAVILTNQSGIGRGIITREQYEAVHAELLRQLENQIDATYFCPDAPDAATARRKPGTGMLEEARRDLGIDLARSWFVGDRDADLLCGRAAGLRAILVRTGYGARANASHAHFVFPEVVSAIQRILRENKN